MIVFLFVLKILLLSSAFVCDKTHVKVSFPYVNVYISQCLSDMHDKTMKLNFQYLCHWHIARKFYFRMLLIQNQ